MSTAVESRRGRHEKDRDRPTRGRARSTAPEGGRPSPLADWRSSWRIALKMARRDLRRHKGRSAVVALMVGIPLLLLSWLAVTGLSLAGNQFDADRLMGSATAAVSGPGGYQVLQNGSDQGYGHRFEEAPGDEGMQNPVDARPIPGLTPGAPAAENAAAIGALTGGAATPIASPSVRVRIGDRNVLMQSLALDGSAVDVGDDKIRLVSGRWPSGANEALVSEPGIRKGLPESGTFEVVTPEGTTTVTVVGVGTGLTTWGMVPHLISAQPLVPDEAAEQQWLITGTDMPFPKVHELGEYGLQVMSAELMNNPVPRDQLPTEVHAGLGYTEYGAEIAAFVTAAALILAIIIGLMVAPAFAVSAARQRHTLALAASNGATTRQLRRTVLAQALLLGALAAVVGALAGVGIAAAMAWRHARTTTDLYLPIISIPWLVIAGFVAIAVLASVTAALLPARRLGRLDIMGVIKGQNVSPPPSRILPVIGVAIMVGGAAAVLYGARQWQGGDYWVTAGSIPLVLGALFLVPTALTLAGRLSSALPVPLRMATRDAARQRTRSVPTVAAVMGGVAALTIGLIAGASDNRENLETYLPTTIMGQGTLYAYDSADVEPALAMVREVLPDAEILPQVRLGGFLGPVAGEQPFVVLTDVGCSPEQAMDDREFWEAQQAAFEAAADQDSFVFEDPPCPVEGGPTGWSGDLVAMPTAEIISRFEFSDAQAAEVREGAVVASGQSRLEGEHVTAFAGTYEFDEATGSPTNIVVTGERAIRLIQVDSAAEVAGQLPRYTAGIIPLELVEAEGWPQSDDGGITYLVNAAAGTEISSQDEELLTERLDNAGFSVERGFHDEMTLFFTILVAAVAFILLVIILTSTALSMSEQRRDDSTMAAVGATRGTRRAMAAAQGFTAAAIGAVLGLLVGIVPGIAFTYPLTLSFPDGLAVGADGNPTPDTTVLGPFIEIPFGFLAVLAIGVPVLAAIISALAVRRAPVVTRRSD